MADAAPAEPSLNSRLQRPVSRRTLLIAGASAAVAGGFAFWWYYPRPAYLMGGLWLNVWLPTQWDDTPEVIAARAAADQIRSLVPRKQSPRPGDWLESHDEEGQTFNQYLRYCESEGKALPGRTIQILPLGTFDARQEQLIANTAEFIHQFYGIAVDLRPAVDPGPPPNDSRRVLRATGKEQYRTGFLLDKLEAQLPAGVAGLIALTPTHLYPDDDWNYVFGQASFEQPVGVWSLARLADPGAPTETQHRRLAQVATHELGHMFGIFHCAAYECGMGGTNNLGELDRGPLAFCPECDAKLWWRFGLDPVSRYKDLQQWCETHSLDRDAADFGRRIEALTAGVAIQK